MSEIKSILGQLKVIPVANIPSVDLADKLVDALAGAGLPCIEITLRTEAGLEAIRSVAGRLNFLVGAGTVHSVDQAKKAAEAGAAFIVTPGLNPKTIQWCLDNRLPIIPGVSTPTDLETALDLGLEIVKFFPAEASGGVPMLKALSGPYHTMKFMPTGGISSENIQDYLSLPSVIACGGSWMVKANLIAEQKFDEIKKLTTEAVQLVNAVQA